MSAKIKDLARNKIWLELLGVALLVFGIIGHAQKADARLDPFYIVSGDAYGKLSPRILFIVDSSATMRYEQPWPDVGCDWGECEEWGADQSRVHGSRWVINKVTAGASEQADFALMTFGQAGSPSSAATVPQKCQSLDLSESHRFVWATTSDAPGYMQKIAGKWQLVPQSSDIINPFGGVGTWVLCGDNRLFPYLRHDNLGTFGLPDDSDAALPDAPLYSVNATEADFQAASNKFRNVQWFPRYIGRRGNLDCNDANQAAIAHTSYGDYGNTDAQRNSEVCGHDFYYWPYVDGFAGYSWHTLNSPDAVLEQECDNLGNCVTQNDTAHRGGVSRRDENVGASLFAPFYSESVLASPDVAAENKGPLTEEDAALIFDGMTSKAYEGGVDVSGNKPFVQVVGDLDDYLNFPGGLPQSNGNILMSNAALSHNTVASYLAFISTVTEEDICRPLAAIFLTDAMPEDFKPATATALHQSIREFRAKLGVKTYVVGFSNEWWNNGLAWDGLNGFACAASGAKNTAIPCGGTNDFDWDTCKNPDDHKNECAYRVSTADELEAVLNNIIGQIVDTAVPSGSPTVANDFIESADPNVPINAAQTSIDAWTLSAGWVGHVAREACTDEDPDNPGQLADYCQNAVDLPVETEETETFGPCPMGRIWDAGECLAQTNWTDRRLYTHDYDNNVFRIADNSGKPTGNFIAIVEQLDGSGLIDPPLSNNAADRKKEIEAMAQWLLGRNMPDSWKLPGLANSAPMLIRRVPEADSSFLPTVGIRDPHCAGRRNALGDNIPESLEEFSKIAWETTGGGGFGEHYDYAEAVLIGDDFGVLHAFHYDSGNELFGFVPLALINNARELSVNGTDNFGQPEELSEHVYGIASTINTGWAFDHDTEQWRHLAVFGFGPGGTEIMTLDVSHMGRLQLDDPIEVVWTTTTADNADDFTETLGETWSRPALTYAVPNHEMSLEPTSYMVFGSGYREGVGADERGRTVWVVDAMTGSKVTQKAFLSLAPDGTTYDVADDVTAMSDIAVGSHCLSRYWGEMQEAYWVDPAGRLYRWDLVTNPSDVEEFQHTADSGIEWPVNFQGFAVAQEAFRFPACQGTNEFSCSISAIGGGSKGDVFTFSPAVAAKNRIDSITNPGEILPQEDRDQFLLALASGSPNDNSIDGGDEENDFHSSIYLLADDHSDAADVHKGFDIPDNAPTTQAGSHPAFMRLPLSTIERTRTIIYPDGTQKQETREFSKRARPIRSPMIRVTGLAEGTEQLDAEVFYITYTIYEPGTPNCDPRWYDEDSGEWILDPGATYEITFRLVLEGDDTINFENQYALPNDPGDGFGNQGKLSGPVVNQQECKGANCGAVLRAPKLSPCDPNANSPKLSGAISVQTGWSELEGFSPLEIQL